MSPQVLHVALVLEQSLRVLAQQSQIVVLCELRETALGLLPGLRDLTGVDETVDIGRDLLVALEVGQAVDELRREGRGMGECEGWGFKGERDTEKEDGEQR